jgi:cell wall-associated NlpC family hydrolase
MSDPLNAPIAIRLQARPGVFPMDEAAEADMRRRIVWEAMSWVGTPYRQMGCTKGVSVDCSMLIARVLIEAGLVEEFDPRPYPPLWFFHRNDERYMDWVLRTARETSTPQPGDIILIKFGRAFAHSGFIIGQDQIVHAFAEDGACVVSPMHHATLLYADRTGTKMRERRTFDVIAGLRGEAA